MEKRFQVFVSSTFADLKNERSKVIQTIMEMDCIPAGMEIFPAIDEEQFNFIKRVIDDCDYYIVIIGGRYGSISEDGLSYTEKEFDYAFEKGIKIIALLHANPDKISVEKSDINPDLRAKLDAFREKVSTHRLVKFWNKAEDLPGLVALSLSKTIKTYPAVGWVRSNSIGSSELLVEINDLRKENQSLMGQILEMESTNNEPVILNNLDLAGLDDKFYFRGSSTTFQGAISKWEIEITWSDLFYIISPFLMEHPNDGSVNKYLARELLNKLDRSGTNPKMEQENFQTLKIHLDSLGLIKVLYTKSTNGSMLLFWNLTDHGEKIMKQIRSVKK